MVHSLYCANFGSASCRQILPLLCQSPQETRRRAKCGDVEVRGWERFINQKTLTCSHLNFPSNTEVSGGSAGKAPVLYCSSWMGPLRTSKISYVAGRTHPFDSSQIDWLCLSQTFDLTCVFESKNGQRGLKYFKEREFSPKYILYLPKFMDLSSFGLWSNRHQTSLFC